jgi:DNA ligase (NAD+)
MLSTSQLEILSRNDLDKTELGVANIAAIIKDSNPRQLSEQELLDFLKITNCLYRAGDAIISDQIYDAVYLNELKRRTPDHPYLSAVEPELAFQGKTITLPEKMLSTDKTFSHEGLKKWLVRIEKATIEIDLDYRRLIFRLTPKLDGFAAYDDGERLYTRGDGRRGTDISRVFSRGLVVGGNAVRGQGAGEIVVSQQYFRKHLAEYFDNSRNFQASIIKEKELDQHALEAIEQKAAVFYPFTQLPDWRGTETELLADLSGIIERVKNLVDYDVDGVIFEIIDSELKAHMGSTRHHHRWQIAFKNNAELAQVKVLQVSAQTSRSGRVNPVAELEPTRLSGALIRRATAHHYGMVKEQGIGPGTIIELTRSGLVIPKIERVITPEKPQIPEQCPSCKSDLVWEKDYLYCLNNSLCPAQIEHTIEHFFKTLRNNDGFGRKTIEKLHSHGINSVYSVYQLTLSDLSAYGFGDKTAQNLLDQLHRSRTEAIEDWRFLGAFGIYRMGLGNCERLLLHHHLSDIFKLSIDDVVEIEGFAEKTAAAVVTNLKLINEQLTLIYRLNFNLTITALLTNQQENKSNSPIFGKSIVFTGTMEQGNREDMKKTAKQLGAKVGNSVTGKTDILVTGAKVGISKLNAAKDKGVQIITERDYFELIETDIAHQ